VISKILFSVLCALLLYASIIDIARLRIPNAVVVAIASLFFPFAPAAQIPLDSFFMHLAAGSSTLVLGFLLFAMGLRFGGGDAKLFAALALWCGFPNLVPFFVVMCLAGGLLALVVLALRRFGAGGFLAARGCRVPALDLEISQPCVPYAPAMAVSFLYVSAVGFGG